MATTNIAKVSSVLSVTVGTARPRYYFNNPIGKYQFATDGSSVNLQIGDLSGIDQYTILFADLQVNGQTPTSVENASVLLNAVFLNSNSGSGGSAGVTIGSPVSGGTNNAVLFTDGTGDIGNSSNLTFDNTNGLGVFTYHLPVVDGANNEVMTTDGAGHASWGTPIASGTVSGAATQIGIFSGAGTVNGYIDFVYDPIATSFVLGFNGAQYITVDQPTDVIQIGDISALANNTFLKINDGTGATTFQKGTNKFLNLDVINRTYGIGDLSDEHNHTKSICDDANSLILHETVSGGVESSYYLDGVNKKYYLDFNGVTYFSADATTQYSQLGNLGSNAAVYVSGAEGAVYIGDIFGATTGLRFRVDGTDGNITAVDGTNKRHFLVDVTSGTEQYGLGDLDNANNSTKIFIADVAQTIALDANAGVYLKLITTTERDALAPTEGAIIYNSTLHKLQIYDGSTWNSAW